MNVEHPPNPHRFRKKAPSRESSLSLSVALCGSQEEEAALKTNTPSNHIQSHPITRHQAPKGPNSTQREGERETATRDRQRHTILTAFRHTPISTIDLSHAPPQSARRPQHSSGLDQGGYKRTGRQQERGAVSLRPRENTVQQCHDAPSNISMVVVMNRIENRN